jgi:hypothetical protein
MTVADEVHMEQRARRPRPMTEILNDIVRQLNGLFRQEMALARAEASEKAGQAIGAVVMMAIGAVLLIPALVILLQAAVAGLIDADFTPAIASLIVGGAVLAIGLILALIGFNRLKVESLMPRRTLTQLQRDAEVAKEQVR